MKSKDIKEIKSITLERATKYCIEAININKSELAPIARVSIAVTVVDITGMVLCTMAMDDVLPISPSLSVRKAITALHTKSATIKLQDKKVNVADFGENYCCFGGGMPIEEGIEIVGAIGISGCNTGKDDHNLAIRILNLMQYTDRNRIK